MLETVFLRELHLEDVQDRYQWMLDSEVTLRFGFEKLDLIKIWLRVDSDNVKAISSYNKVGFMNEGMMRMDRYRKGEFIDRLRMSMLRSEFVTAEHNEIS